MIVLKDNNDPWIHLNKMAKLREELIKDIIGYLEIKELNYNTIENDITQIIVDTFDEYEYDNNPKI